MQSVLEALSLSDVAARSRTASLDLSTVTTAQKNACLLDLGDRLVRRMTEVLEANRAEMERARASGMEPPLLDRLLLTEDRLTDMARDVRRIAGLPDPIGEEFDQRVLANGLQLSRRRVPIGVIAVIYEARPNVTVDVASLCIKSGNAVILRGGKEALDSNGALADLIRESLSASALPLDAVHLIREPDRAQVLELIQMRGSIDLIVPRGGSTLIELVRDNARVPVLAGGIGVCHTYVHADADLGKAVAIVNNAKVRRPSVCNALDTVLVHRQIAPAFLEALADLWDGEGVEMRCDAAALALLQALGAPGRIVPANDDDFGREFLSLRASVRVVENIEEAIDHIKQHGSGHSEAIVTEGYGAAQNFVNRIDAAAVYVNASTGFTDGGQYGLGAEIGISTQKFHARGPLGLEELTSYKWVALGNGQIRP